MTVNLSPPLHHCCYSLQEPPCLQSCPMQSQSIFPSVDVPMSICSLKPLGPRGPSWRSRLRIKPCYCSGSGYSCDLGWILGPGRSTGHRCSPPNPPNPEVPKGIPPAELSGLISYTPGAEGTQLQGWPPVLSVLHSPPLEPLQDLLGTVVRMWPLVPECLDSSLGSAKLCALG